MGKQRYGDTKNQLPGKPELLDPQELQANWSYWGLTVPTTVTAYDATGTKATVTFTPPRRGVDPAGDMQIEDVRLF